MKNEMTIGNLPEKIRQKLINVGFKEKDTIDGNVEGVDSENAALCGFYILTPLTYAVRKGDLEVVKCLIEHGADIDKKDDTYELPPIIWAAWYGRDKVAKYLLEKGANTKLTSSTHILRGKTPLEATKAYSECSLTNFWYKAQKCFGTGDIDKTRALLAKAETDASENINQFGN